MPGNSLGRLSVFLDVDLRRFSAGIATAKGQLKGMSQSIKRNSAQWKAAGRKMMLAGAAMTAATGLMVKAAIDFEDQMARVNTMLTDSTEHYLPEFTEGIKKLAVDFGQSTKALTDGLYDVLSAQVDAGDAMEFMKVASESAVGGFVDTNTAVSAMLTMMKTYGDELKDAADASDFLHAVVERGRITYQELADTLGTTAAIAQKAGLSLEGYGAAIAVMTKGGLEARKAMTALRGLLRSVMKRSPEAVEAAEKLGITWDMNAVKGENLVDTLKKLGKANIDQLNAISPNIRGLLGWAIAAKNADEAAKDYEAILDRLGITQNKFEKAQKTTRFKLQQLKEEFGMMSITIGEVLLPAVRDLVGVLSSIIKKVKDFAKQWPKLFEVIVKVTAVLGPLLISFGGLAMMLPGIVTAFGLLGGTLGPIILAFTAMTASIGFLLSKKNALMSFVKSLQAGFVGIALKLNEWALTITKVFNKIPFVNLEDEIIELNNRTQGLRETYTTLLNESQDFKDKFLKEEELKQKQKELNQLKETIDIVKKALANATNEAAKKKLEAQLTRLENTYKDAKDEINKLKTATEDLDKTMGDTEAEKNQENAIKDIGTAADEAAKKTEDSFKAIESLSEQTARNVQDAFNTFFFDAFTGKLKNIQSIFEGFGRAMLKTISNLFAQLTIESMGLQEGSGWGGLLSKIGGLFSFGGGVADPIGGGYPGGYSGMSGLGHAGGLVKSSGIIKAHNGLAPDEIPSILQTGEAVISRRGMKSLGSDGVRSLNSGKGIGNSYTTIQPVVVIQAWDSRDVARNMDTISQGLAQSLRSNSPFREAVKKYGR